MDLLLIRFAQLFSPDEVDVPKSTPDQLTIDAILEVVFALAGIISVIVIIIAGFRFVLSQGDPGQTTKARNAILYALVGLGVSIFAFTIVRFVIGEVG